MNPYLRTLSRIAGLDADADPALIPATPRPRARFEDWGDDHAPMVWSDTTREIDAPAPAPARAELRGTQPPADQSALAPATRPADEAPVPVAPLPAAAMARVAGTGNDTAPAASALPRPPMEAVVRTMPHPPPPVPQAAAWSARDPLSFADRPLRQADRVGQDRTAPDGRSAQPRTTREAAEQPQQDARAPLPAPLLAEARPASLPVAPTGPVSVPPPVPDAPVPLVIEIGRLEIRLDAPSGPVRAPGAARRDPVVPTLADYLADAPNRRSPG